MYASCRFIVPGDPAALPTAAQLAMSACIVGRRRYRRGHMHLCISWAAISQPACFIPDPAKQRRAGGKPHGVHLASTTFEMLIYVFPRLVVSGEVLKIATRVSGAIMCRYRVNDSRRRPVNVAQAKYRSRAY